MEWVSVFLCVCLSIILPTSWVKEKVHCPEDFLGGNLPGWQGSMHQYLLLPLWEHNSTPKLLLFYHFSFHESLGFSHQRRKRIEDGMIEIKIWLPLTCHWPGLCHLGKEAGKCSLAVCRFGEQLTILCHIIFCFLSYLCSITWYLRVCCPTEVSQMLLFPWYVLHSLAFYTSKNLFKKKTIKTVIGKPKWNIHK